MLRAILNVIGRLPLRYVHATGALLGRLVYLVSPKYRRRFKENLVSAIPQQKAILKQAVAEAGKGFLELPTIWFRLTQNVVQLVAEVTGVEYVEAAWREGKGIIFLTPHLGCFEITPIRYSAHAPITILYRPPRIPALRPLIAGARDKRNITLATTDFTGVKKLVSALKRKEAVGILPDQVPSFGEGVWAPFFGRPAYTMTLVSRLQQMTGATILLGYAQRLPRGRGYHIHISPIAPLSGTLEEQARQLNQSLENIIRKYPEQYLWGYNRYKVPRGAKKPPKEEDSLPLKANEVKEREK